MRRLLLTSVLVITLFTLALPQSRASAQILAAGEIIDLVNTLRTGYGLPGLVVDSILNSTAYSTAATMAANGVCAHIGGARERIAAAGFGGACVALGNMIQCRSQLSIRLACTSPHLPMPGWLVFNLGVIF